MFNEKAVENIEVKLCEKFSTFSGCGGETFTSKTDKDGEYLIANVNPKEYQGLIVKVFDTKMYVFASNRFGITASKYKIEADKTFFAPDTNLYKSDIKITSPKAKAKVDAKALEITWEAIRRRGVLQDRHVFERPENHFAICQRKGRRHKLQRRKAADEWRISAKDRCVQCK